MLPTAMFVAVPFITVLMEPDDVNSRLEVTIRIRVSMRPGLYRVQYCGTIQDMICDKPSNTQTMSNVCHVRKAAKGSPACQLF